MSRPVTAVSAVQFVNQPTSCVKYRQKVKDLWDFFNQYTAGDVIQNDNLHLPYVQKDSLITVNLKGEVGHTVNAQQGLGDAIFRPFKMEEQADSFYRAFVKEELVVPKPFIDKIAHCITDYNFNPNTAKEHHSGYIITQYRPDITVNGTPLSFGRIDLFFLPIPGMGCGSDAFIVQFTEKDSMITKLVARSIGYMITIRSFNNTTNTTMTVVNTKNPAHEIVTYYENDQLKETNHRRLEEGREYITIQRNLLEYETSQPTETVEIASSGIRHYVDAKGEYTSTVSPEGVSLGKSCTKVDSNGQKHVQAITYFHSKANPKELTRVVCTLQSPEVKDGYLLDRGRTNTWRVLREGKTIAKYTRQPLDDELTKVTSRSYKLFLEALANGEINFYPKEFYQPKEVQEVPAEQEQPGVNFDFTKEQALALAKAQQAKNQSNQ